MVEWIQDRSKYMVAGAVVAALAAVVAAVLASVRGLPTLPVMVTAWEWIAAVGFFLWMVGGWGVPADSSALRAREFFRVVRHLARFSGVGCWVIFVISLIVRASFGLGLELFFVE